MKKLVALIFLILTSCPVFAQTFSSGSTGADGALDLTGAACNVCEVQLPESGILNYTTVNITNTRTLIFKRNFRNTPVIILAQGNVIIAGKIDISGSPGSNIPGPGGFYGGDPNKNGFGPGGGQPPNYGGRWVGALSLVPIVGGSGGFGYTFYGNLPGGGGGGALVIASSTSIVVSGSILAMGGGGGYGSFGSGGAIRIVANSVNVSGNLQSCGGECGVIRFEAPAGSLVFTGSANPLPILSTTINSQIVSGNSTPSLNITSIGGFPVSYTAGRPDMVDLILPTQVSDPINVVVQAHNIPVGTQVNLNVSGTASGTVTPGTLSGTQASSSATIAVSGLSRSGATYLIAFAEFTLPASAANSNPKGPDQITKVRIIAKPGANSTLVFLRKNGTEIALAKVPRIIKQELGLK